jgi:hypothetical protein
VANPLLSRRDLFPHQSHVGCTRPSRSLSVPLSPRTASRPRARKRSPMGTSPAPRAHGDISAYFPQPPHDSHLPTDLPPCASPRAPHVPPPRSRPAAAAPFSTIWTRRPLRGGSHRPPLDVYPSTRACGPSRTLANKQGAAAFALRTAVSELAYMRGTIADTRRRTTSATSETTVIPAARRGAARSSARTGSGRRAHVRPRTASRSRRGTVAAPYRDAKARPGVLLRRLHARAAV